MAALVGVLAVSPPAPAQTRPRNPPADGPWNRGRSDPTDSAKQSEAQQRKAQEYLDAGNKLLDKGDIQGAKTKFKSVVEMVGPQGIGLSALGQLQSIHNQGEAELQRANALFEEGKYAESLQVAKRTKVLYAAIFDGVPGGENRPNLAQAAARLIERIEADPKAAAVFREEQAAKLYRRVPRLEEAAEKDGTKYFDLYKTVKKIANKFPGCPTGEKCGRRLEQLQADRRIHRLIQQEGDRRFIVATLGHAEEYERAGKTDSAAAEYDKLRKKFPDKTLAELRRIAKRSPQPSD